MPLPDYQAAMRWLFARINYENLTPAAYNARWFNLRRMRRLLAGLGHPERGMRIVHVAGTKGKGSTCAMLAAALAGCGQRVGLYTSPHLVDLRERIAVDAAPIAHDELLDHLRAIAAVEPGLEAQGIGAPTFFEVLTAAAVRHFAVRRVDTAVLETGLGGRLDSTNAVRPAACGITHIDLDHTNALGDTLAKIAREKAGILKRQTPAVCAAQAPDAGDVIARVAARVRAPLWRMGHEMDLRVHDTRAPNAVIDLDTPRRALRGVRVPLPGRFQAGNAAMALALADRLDEAGVALPTPGLLDGLAKTRLAGRMQVVCRRPRVMIDAAHNPASLAALLASLPSVERYRRLVVVFGCATDKDAPSMLASLAPVADRVVLTTADSRRMCEPADLLAHLDRLAPDKGRTAADFDAAWRSIADETDADTLVLVTGSFYLLGAALRTLARENVLIPFS